MNKSWEVILEEAESGEIILPVPPELIEENGWREGDELEFEIQEDCVVITNASEKLRKLHE